MRFFTGLISNMVCFLLWTSQNAVIRAELYRIHALFYSGIVMLKWPDMVDDDLQRAVAAKLVDI